MDDWQATGPYFRLEIVASSSTTQIWLGDTEGYFVQKEVGQIVTSLLPGDYVVQFELGTQTYPIRLAQDYCTTQAVLTAGPTCPRPVFRWPPEESV